MWENWHALYAVTRFLSKGELIKRSDVWQAVTVDDDDDDDDEWIYFNVT